ncbi:MAG: hypothetical protein Q8L41_13460 [Anaerolineales bacterium]|nr:hypothetical protein [Anaerolineales bacterium]
MIRLTVLYNLQPYVDEVEFLEWRLTDHQVENMAVQGVLCSDFSRITEGWPVDLKPPYQFMTTADWPNMESYRNDFYDEDYQAKLRENIKMLKDPIFLVSEILIHETKEANQ